MKKLLWSVAAATLLFASCATDDAEVVTIPASDDFTATINADSRTVLDGTAVLWEADDALTIFTKTAHNRKYTVKSGANTRSATFGYVCYTGSDATKITSNYAIYPYDATATISGDVISTTTASEQRYDATKVDLAHSIMVAKSDDNTLSFKNAGALLRFAVSKEDLPEAYTLETITLVSANNALAGAATINLADDHKLVVAEDGSKTISLTEINAEITTEAQFFHIALPALNFVADDLAVTFTFEDGTKTFTLPAFELTQNTIKTINYQIKADDFNGSTGEGLSVQVSTPEALQEAVVNPEVSTVVLTDDIELTEPLKFGAPLTRAATANEGREFTLDLNGRAIKQTKTECEAYAMIENLANLTITDSKGNGKIEITYNGTPSTAVAVNAISNKGNLVINGGTIINNGNGNQIGYAIDNYYGSSLTVNGGKIEAKGSSYYDGIRLFCSNTQEINVTVNGGEISSIWAQNPTADKAGEVKGTVVINGGAVATTYYERFTTVKVKNGVTATVTPYGTGSDKTYTVEEEGYTVHNFVLPGEIASAEELAAAIEKGGNITLNWNIVLANTLTIPADKTVTLNLNGYTISQTKAQTTHYAMIENYGNLTITDNKGEGKISYTDSGNGGEYVSNTISNYGTLTIQGGMIENMSSETVARNGYPHPIDNSGKLVINSGEFTNANYSSMRIWCTEDTDTEVIINGGTFNGAIDFQTVSDKPNKGTLTINGGTFNPDTYTNAAVRLLGFGVDVDEMHGYIKGGTFNGAVKLNKFVSGEFNSQVFFISGGVFKFDPSAFVAENYRAKEVGDVWQIVNAYELTDEADLFWLANEVNVNGNDFSGKTFKLMNDVALTKEWTPIGLGSDNYTKTLKADFDGNKKTISNMIVNGTEHVGFFGAKVKGNVTDLYIDKASISGTHYAGGIVGWMHNVAEVGHNAVLNVQGCKVTNSTITLDTDNASDNGDKIGGIAGFVYLGTVKSCEVANTTIKGYRDCGGIVGYTSDYTAENYFAVVENNVVGANVKLIVDNDVNYKNYSKQSDYDFDHIIGEACALTKVSDNTGTVTIDWGQISAE